MTTSDAATHDRTPNFAELTTLRVGGPATRIVDGTSVERIVDALSDAWADGDEWMVVGGGSNLLVADDGFDGTAVLVRNTGVEVLEQTDDTVTIRVAAGESWDGLVATTVERGWSGIEALSGIPGIVGAAPVQNIGAYGVEVAEVLESIDFLDAESGDRVRVPAAELELGYRTSTLKRGRRGVVLSVDLRLGRATDDGVPVRYAQLAGSLGVELGSRVPGATVRDAVLALRASKGMVLDEGDRDTWSAGSFFTNPIVSAEAALSLPDDAPRWPVADAPDPAPVKLSAAWLIERAGVTRGYALPGSAAAVSSKHTLALTNRGGATAEQVAELARYVQAMVLSRFGVSLVPEPVLVGDFGA